MKHRKYKKTIETRYIILFIILSTGVVIGLISLLVRDDRPLSFVEKGLKDVGIGVQRVLYAPFRFVTDKIDNFREMKKIYLKYKNKEYEESKSTLYKEENEELISSINELRELLKLNSTLTEYTTINATVINRDVGNWYNTITVDKGEKNGIKKNMIAINNAGLIGKVIKTTFYTSDIKLVTTSDLNTKMSVGIKTGDTITYGLLSGYDKIENKLLVIDIIDDANIKEGNIVITSGLGNSYPKGITVGTVSKIEKNEFGISNIIYVKPGADFSSLRYISILKEPNK